MTVKVPDRTGWVTGALATYPAVPPFPALTGFEWQALTAIADLFEPDDRAAYLQQIANVQVIDRINAICGFYTRISIDPASCAPVQNLTRKGGHFDVEGIELGMGVVLWDDDGYLSQIEGYTYGEGEYEALRHLDLASLKMLRVQLG